MASRSTHNRKMFFTDILTTRIGGFSLYLDDRGIEIKLSEAEVKKIAQDVFVHLGLHPSQVKSGESERFQLGPDAYDWLFEGEVFDA